MKDTMRITYSECQLVAREEKQLTFTLVGMFFGNMQKNVVGKFGVIVEVAPDGAKRVAVDAITADKVYDLQEYDFSGKTKPTKFRAVNEFDEIHQLIANSANGNKFANYELMCADGKKVPTVFAWMVETAKEELQGVSR